MTGLILALTVATQGASPAAEFEQRLKAATGPLSLHALSAWCRKNKLQAEDKRVREVIAKVAPPRKPAADGAGRGSPWRDLRHGRQGPRGARSRRPAPVAEGRPRLGLAPVEFFLDVRHRVLLVIAHGFAPCF